jgi:hypothetical protein
MPVRRSYLRDASIHTPMLKGFGCTGGPLTSSAGSLGHSVAPIHPSQSCLPVASAMRIVVSLAQGRGKETEGASTGKVF